MSRRDRLCSYGQHIGEQEECEQAAKYLGIEFKGFNYQSSYPKGCYLKYSFSKMYFNTHVRGNASEYAKQICTKQRKRGK